ncbi:MAG: arylesterase [Chloroflexota bacterium]
MITQNRHYLHSLILVVVLVLLPACGADEGSNTADTTSNEITDNTPARTIVAMGDSLTEGLGVDESQAYPALLEQKLKVDGYNFNVLNAGVSGETSSGALSRVAWILNLEPDIVILETGANDGLRGIDPELTRDNINKIVTLFQTEGITVVLAGMEMMENLGQDYTTAFEALYPDIAAEQDLILIPFFLEGVVADPALNQADAVHPNEAGYEVIVDEIYPYIIEAIDRLNTD